MLLRPLLQRPSYNLAVFGLRENLGRSFHQSSTVWNTKTGPGPGAAKSAPPSEPKAEEIPGDIHFKLTRGKHPLGIEITKKVTTSYWDNPVPHPIYSPAELTDIKKTHVEPSKPKDRLALFAVKCMRGGFDFVSRYKGPGGEMTKRDWLNRCLFLETIAGVPGKFKVVLAIRS
jgi:hypothetical protein